MEPNKLSDKSRAILEAIAKGHTYEQILVQELAWTYHDIFRAASEALELAESAGTKKSYDDRLAEIKQEHAKGSNSHFGFTDCLKAKDGSPAGPRLSEPQLSRTGTSFPSSRAPQLI